MNAPAAHGNGLVAQGLKKPLVTIPSSTSIPPVARLPTTTPSSTGVIVLDTLQIRPQRFWTRASDASS